MSLSVTGLSYTYGRKQALDSVDLAVEEGAFCALLGPNGAGKSTLFALLTRLFVAPKGQIEMAGHDLARHPRAALARMGVVFQSSTLDMDLSVRRNLSYFAALHGITGRAAQARIDAALTRLDMAERAHETVRNLNGGHRRRAEIARALIHQPKVLLLDEPTVGLDAESRHAITDHVHRLCAEDGLTVLWATHLTDEIDDTDRLAILHQGRIIADGRAGAIRKGLPLTDRFLQMTGTKRQEAAL